MAYHVVRGKLEKVPGRSQRGRRTSPNPYRELSRMHTPPSRDTHHRPFRGNRSRRAARTKKTQEVPPCRASP